MLAAGCRASDPPPQDLLRAGILTIGSLDPLAVSASERAGSETLVRRQVFEGLVRYDPETLAPEPAVAESWTASDDARTFTFVLRDGVRFHNGRDVTPGDVVFSLSRLARAACLPGQAPTAGAPSPLLALVAGYPDVATACATDRLTGVVGAGERTVVITLSEPWADLPSALGNVAASIVPADVVSRDEPGFGIRPVGTGPYRVQRPWDGRAVRLARFDEWWGPPPAVPAVELIGYGDDTSAYLDLLQGRLHYAPVPSGRAAEARRRFGEDGFVLGTGLYFFGFNLSSPRVADPGFRHALSRAVDRVSLASAIFKGTRDPAAGVLPPSLPGVEQASCRQWCTFDLDAARQGVAEAFPTGPPELVLSVSSMGPNPEVAQALSRMLADAGVAVRVVERPVREHLRGVQQADADLFQLGLIPEYPSPDGLLWPLLLSGARDNYMRYSNAAVDRLLAEARRTIDPDARAPLFEQAEGLVHADLPVLPLLWFRSSVAVDERVRADGGPLVDGLGVTDFARLRFDQ